MGSNLDNVSQWLLLEIQFRGEREAQKKKFLYVGCKT